MSATIKVYFLIGDTIEDACIEAHRIAVRIWCYVEFEFNGITCTASPTGDPKILAAEYRRLLNLDGPMKMAFDR